MLNSGSNNTLENQERFAIAKNRLNRDLRNMFMCYLILPSISYFIGLALLQHYLRMDYWTTVLMGAACYCSASLVLANRLANHAANRTNKLLSVLADFSHEFASPLANIKGLIHSAGKTADATCITKDQLELFSVSCERLCSLHRDLRVLAMWGAPLKHSELSLFNSGALVKECTDELLPKCTSKGVNLVLVARTSSVIIADKQAIGRVISNLLENALKYCPAGTDIVVVSDVVKSHVIYEVKDNGPGLPTDALNRIFDRHFRAESHEVNSVSGNGLGMYIAKEIVESHGGNLTVEKVFPKGLKFVVQFPTSPSRHPFSQLFEKMT